MLEKNLMERNMVPDKIFDWSTDEVKNLPNDSSLLISDESFLILSYNLDEL